MTPRRTRRAAAGGVGACLGERLLRLLGRLLELRGDQGEEAAESLEREEGPDDRDQEVEGAAGVEKRQGPDAQEAPARARARRPGVPAAPAATARRPRTARSTSTWLAREEAAAARTMPMPPRTRAQWRKAPAKASQTPRAASRRAGSSMPAVRATPEERREARRTRAATASRAPAPQERPAPVGGAGPPRPAEQQAPRPRARLGPALHPARELQQPQDAGAHGLVEVVRQLTPRRSASTPVGEVRAELAEGAAHQTRRSPGGRGPPSPPPPRTPARGRCGRPGGRRPGRARTRRRPAPTVDSTGRTATRSGFWAITWSARRSPTKRGHPGVAQAQGGPVGEGVGVEDHPVGVGQGQPRARSATPTRRDGPRREAHEGAQVCWTGTRAGLLPGSGPRSAAALFTRKPRGPGRRLSEPAARGRRPRGDVMACLIPSSSIGSWDSRGPAGYPAG